MLPGNGQVLAAEGQKIAATAPIASFLSTGRFIRADLGQILGTKSPEKINKALQRKAGNLLAKGDVIAQTKGVISRIYRAPADCKIISIENGEILLEVDAVKSNLPAGYSGTVINSIPNRGVVIECEGSLIQCVWSNGKSGSGVLFSGLEQPAQQLSRSSINVTSRGSIYLSGSCLELDALQAAVELPVRGLILSSMASALIPEAMKASVPIFITEGFGNIPMNSPAFHLLTTNHQKEIDLVSPEPGNYTEQRPELFIALDATANSIEEAPPFSVGQKIRCNISPLTGKVGTITQILKEPVELSSNIYAACVEVQLENDQKTTIPVANMDILY